MNTFVILLDVEPPSVNSGYLTWVLFYYTPQLFTRWTTSKLIVLVHLNHSVNSTKDRLFSSWTTKFAGSATSTRIYRQVNMQCCDKWSRFWLHQVERCQHNPICSIASLYYSILTYNDDSILNVMIVWQMRFEGVSVYTVLSLFCEGRKVISDGSFVTYSTLTYVEEINTFKNIILSIIPFSQFEKMNFPNYGVVNLFTSSF